MSTDDIDSINQGIRKLTEIIDELLRDRRSKIGSEPLPEMSAPVSNFDVSDIQPQMDKLTKFYDEYISKFRSTLKKSGEEGKQMDREFIDQYNRLKVFFTTLRGVDRDMSKDLRDQFNTQAGSAVQSMGVILESFKNTLRVWARGRYVDKAEAEDKDRVLGKIIGRNIEIVQGKEKRQFGPFFRIYDPRSTNGDVFYGNSERKCKPAIPGKSELCNLSENLMRGDNVVVIALGASGSGKTHTLIGQFNERGQIVDPGVIILLIETLLDKKATVELACISELCLDKFGVHGGSVRMQYKTKYFVGNDSSSKVRFRDYYKHKAPFQGKIDEIKPPLGSGFKITGEGPGNETVKNEFKTEFINLTNIINNYRMKNGTVADTPLNDQSSRSGLEFQFVINPGTPKEAHLLLVDMPGRENPYELTNLLVNTNLKYTANMVEERFSRILLEKFSLFVQKWDDVLEKVGNLVPKIVNVRRQGNEQAATLLRKYNITEDGVPKEVNMDLISFNVKVYRKHYPTTRSGADLPNLGLRYIKNLNSFIADVKRHFREHPAIITEAERIKPLGLLDYTSSFSTVLHNSLKDFENDQDYTNFLRWGSLLAQSLFVNELINHLIRSVLESQSDHKLKKLQEGGGHTTHMWTSISESLSNNRSWAMNKFRYDHSPLGTLIGAYQKGEGGMSRTKLNAIVTYSGKADDVKRDEGTLGVAALLSGMTTDHGVVDNWFEGSDSSVGVRHVRSVELLSPRAERPSSVRRGVAAQRSVPSIGRGPDATVGVLGPRRQIRGRVFIF
jgi:hypothetical protein